MQTKCRQEFYFLIKNCRYSVKKIGRSIIVSNADNISAMAEVKQMRH